MKNILYIVPSDYDSLEKKGVINLILERDEGDFFETVLTLHPFTKNDNVVNLTTNNKVIEYGWKFNKNYLNNFLIIKIFGTLIILFKLAFVFPFLIKKEKISIIRATDPYYMGLIGLCYSKLLNIPFVVSVHSDYDMGEKLGGQTFKILGSRKLAKNLEKFIYKSCDLVLPIRNYLKKKIINEYDINHKKIKVFPHGINFEYFDNTEFIDIHQKFNIGKEKKVISFIGRLSKENYVYQFCDIAIKLKELRNDFILLVVGDGNEYLNIKKQIINSNLNDFIKLVRFQDKDIVTNVRKQNYISLCLMGGFSLIEACAGARPVISYDIEWHYELVKDAITGYLIEENNIDKVIKKIDYLFTNYTQSDLLGKNARDLVFKNHDINKTIKIKQNIYKRILLEY